MKRGKKYAEAAKLVDRTKKYPVLEAVDLAKKTSYAKFDASIEAAFRLNLDPRKAEQNLRGAIVLPHGTGKTLRVCVIAKGAKAQAAQEAGADYVGDSELIQKIQKENWFDFDVMVATPDMMAELGRLGRILGPKGLMPNPKTGTVTLDVAKAVKDAKAGKVEFRADKQGMIHCPVGKAQFSTEDLMKNFVTFAEAIIKAKPSAAKGTYLKSVYLTTTMGPGIKLDAKNLPNEVKSYLNA